MLTIIEHMYNFHVKGGGLHFGIPDYQTCFQNVIKIYVREGLKSKRKSCTFGLCSLAATSVLQIKKLHSWQQLDVMFVVSIWL